MRRLFIKSLIFVLIPLIVGELIGRFWSGPSWYEHWYAAQTPAISEARQCYLFVGTSRVAAAIDEQAFAASLQDVEGCNGPAFNLGLGYSTLAEAYLGLRRISESRPNGLSGCTVLVEAPVGIPSWDSWADSWIAPPAAGPLVGYIEFRDVAPFLFYSATPLGDKMFVLAAKLLKSPEVIARLRAKLGSIIDDASMSSEVRGDARDNNAPALVSKGGIRNDAYGAEVVRQAALKQALTALGVQQPVSEAIWSKSVLKSIVSLVRQKGGKIVIFNMPLSSVQQAPLTTAQRMNDKKLFLRMAEDWNVPLLAVPIELSDKDFPDLWHLSKTRAQEFTQSLARLFVQEICNHRSSSK